MSLAFAICVLDAVDIVQLIIQYNYASHKFFYANKLMLSTYAEYM